MMSRLFYSWVRKYQRPQQAADYIVQFPFETTPHMLLGTGMPFGRSIDPTFNSPAFDVPLGYTQSGFGGPVHGNVALSPLSGVSSNVGL